MLPKIVVMKLKIYYYLQWLIVVVMTITMWSMVINKIMFPGSETDYGEFFISDYLINYQGGLVRRGFIGEVLYRIYCFKPYNVKFAIIIIDLLSFCSFFIISIIAFLRRKWSMMPLLFPYVCVNEGLVGFRRDFLMMVIIYFVYDFFFKYWCNQNVKHLTAGVILLSIGMFIYEPIFFLTVPILGLMFLLNQDKNKSIFNRIIRALVIFIIPIVSIGILFVCKGGEDVAQKIWDSWNPLFAAYPEKEPASHIGWGVDFLRNDSMLDVIKFNSSLLFRIDEWPRFGMIYSNILLLISFPLIWFLVIRVPSYDTRKKVIVQNNNNSVILSNVFLIQVASMLPMFGMLSCDFGRTMPYCIYTTFFFVHLSLKYGITLPYPHFLTRFSEKVNYRLSNNKITSSFLFYVFVLFVTPLRGWQAPKFRDTLSYLYFNYTKKLTSLLF